MNFTQQIRPAILPPPESYLRPRHSRGTGLSQASREPRRGQESPSPLKCAESKIAPITPLECSVSKMHHVKFFRMCSLEERRREGISRWVPFIVKHLLLFLALIKCPPHNCFVLIFMHFDGRSVPPSPKFPFLQRRFLALPHSLPFLPSTDHGQRSRARGLGLPSFSSRSTVNCELTTAPQNRSTPITPTRHQSLITSHAQ